MLPSVQQGTGGDFVMGTTGVHGYSILYGSLRGTPINPKLNVRLSAGTAKKVSLNCGKPHNTAPTILHTSLDSKRKAAGCPERGPGVGAPKGFIVHLK